jgi:DNA-directed RNA polymerase specialized sigma24 family protein
MSFEPTTAGPEMPSAADLESFGAWWRARDERAVRLLDELAARADDDIDALAALLGLILDNGLCRPALRTLLVDEHDLEDAEQAALAVVSQRLGQFEGRSRFTTWLHQVAVNEARMLIRSRARRPHRPISPASRRSWPTG